jgi:hypothetical protein
MITMMMMMMMPFLSRYRHMIRWYSLLLYPYAASLGYRYVMRLDDDSYIHSRIGYDLFGFMETHGLIYGFRQEVGDGTMMMMMMMMMIVMMAMTTTPVGSSRLPLRAMLHTGCETPMTLQRLDACLWHMHRDRYYNF